jgi:Phosphotransferase enzyme family
MRHVSHLAGHLTRETCQNLPVAEDQLDGGNTGGAVRSGDTVRRAAGPWTPAVHALLTHLAAKNFPGAPRPLGFDDQGREVLTFIEGETTGSRKPWPAWTHAEDTLDQVARWLRGYHQAVADFVPPPGAVWREGGTWSPGLIIGHNDTAPYNAAWHQGTLAGFFDWDFAGPATPAWDLAFAAFSWVPLHARHVVAAEGFTDFAARPDRLQRFLREYGWTATEAEFLEVVRARVQAHADGIRANAAAGNEVFMRLLSQGVADDLDRALAELRAFPA